MPVHRTSFFRFPDLWPALRWAGAFVPLLGATLCGQEADEPVFALDAFSVTASRFALPLEQIGSSVSVVTAGDLELAGDRFVGDALRGLPGVVTLANGGPGKNTEVSLRGVEDNQVLVLINGLELRNSATSGAAINLGALGTGNIERIEVVRGPQSVVYGSHAIGGVINIITKQRATEGVGGTAEVSYGSFETFEANATLNGRVGPLRFNGYLSRFDSEGFSAANVNGDALQEDDGFERWEASWDLGYDFSEHTSLDAYLLYTDDKNETDSGRTDIGDRQDREQWVLNLRGRTLVLEDRWEIKPGFALVDSTRTALSDGNPSTGAEGQSLTLELDTVYEATAWATLLAGVEWSEDEANNTNSRDPYVEERSTVSGYAQSQLSFDNRLFLNVGMRVDDSDDFGTEATWRLAPSYVIRETGTRLYGSIGTAFRAPSLSEQFDTFGGFATPNPALVPEESDGWEVGLEQAWFEEALFVGVNYFDNDIDNQIAFDRDIDQFLNIEAVRARGVEAYATIRPSDRVRLNLNYTYLDAEDRTTGLQIRRRPHHSFSRRINWEAIAEKLHLRLGVRYRGEQFDDPNEVAPVDSFTVVNLSARYHLSAAVTLFGRIDNLFDEDYEEVDGFNSADLSGYFGVRYRF